MEIVLTEVIVSDTSVQVIASSEVNGSYTSVRVTASANQICALSATQQRTGTGLAVLISVGSGCAPSSGTSGKPHKRTNYALIGGLVGGLVGGVLVIGVILIVLFKTKSCRCLFKAREDEEVGIR